MKLTPKEKIIEYISKNKEVSITSIYRNTKVNYYSIKTHLNALEKEGRIKIEIVKGQDEYGNIRTNSIHIKWLK